MHLKNMIVLMLYLTYKIQAISIASEVSENEITQVVKVNDVM